MDPKLRTLSQALPISQRYSSTKKKGNKRSNRFVQRKTNTDLLRRCEQAWNNKSDIRYNRERTSNYVFGDQWNDVIEYHDGITTERKYIQMRGNVPLQNNIMISIFNSVVGLYAKQGTEPLCFARTHDAQPLSDMMSATMQANWQETKMQDALIHAFSDYLNGGVAIAREVYEEREGWKDAWTDFINPNYAFWEAGTDVRHNDIRLIGVLHDVAPGELFRKFCNDKYGWTVEEISDVFNINEPDGWAIGNNPYYRLYGNQQNEQDRLGNISFDRPSDESLCRLIEVWFKRSKTRYQCYDPIASNADDMEFRVELKDIYHIEDINAKRKSQYDEALVPQNDRAYIRYDIIEDDYWCYAFLAPDGTVIAEGETPYDFHSHPFTIRLYPYVNAEVHPFMGNVIDQQRYINRLIIMHDMAARSAAKGLTIFPVECIPEGYTKQDIADEITEYDGLLFFDTNRLNPNLRPEIITSNAVQIGTTELLQMQLNLIRDITNVSGALQGKTPSAGTSASRYAQETQNATTSLFALLQGFSSFAESIARKKCMVIQQFYPQGRHIINRDNTGMIEYDRMSARDVMFKISIKEAAATASFQQSINDTALQLLQMQAINIKQYLSAVNLPFADSLLQQIEAQEQEAAAQAAAMQQAYAQPSGNMATSGSNVMTQPPQESVAQKALERKLPNQ
jgi:hypothetical protein